MVSLLEGERVVEFADLAPQEQEMLRRAQRGLVRSHHPYSKSEHYVASTVLAVLLGATRYYTSPNIEVRPRGGACAEDAAILMTIASGHQAYAQAICVIDQNGDGSPTEEVPYPCPTSRGAIAEIAQLSGLREDFPIILSTTNFDKVVVTTIGVLLPHGFDYP
ncbi:MAG TPA: cytidine deaminase [Candidatus Paceibacterota bacterium]